MSAFSRINSLFLKTCQRSKPSDINRILTHPATSEHIVCYSQEVPAPSIDKNLLSKLRKQTGFAFSNCRKALVVNDNNFEQALEWLHEEAAKEGWAKANKLADRPMSQGVVGLVKTDSCALILEVNCETDFVAKNVKFLELVSGVTHLCFDQLKSSQDARVELKGTSLTSITDSSSQTIADIVAKEVGSIGENIQASRATFISSKGDNSYIGHYLHTAGLNEKCLEVEGCHFGKYAGVTVLQGAAVPSEEWQKYGTQISQHIVGMNPKSIDTMETPDELEAASDHTQSDIPDHTQSDTSDHTQSKPSAEKKEWEESRLLYQEFLLDPDLTVKKWLEQRNIRVDDFVRFAVGENAKW